MFKYNSKLIAKSSHILISNSNSLNNLTFVVMVLLKKYILLN